MPNTKLKEALNNCLVNFDRRVLVTDLLEEYDSTYQEVHETLETHIRKQEAEQGAKYEKRFLVHGESKEGNNEVYTVVQGEKKLKEWLAKLKNAESSLYSVEIAGGSKASPQIFKPIRKCAIEVKNLKVRENTNKNIANRKTNGVPTATTAAIKSEVKPDKQPEAKKPKAVLAASFGKKPIAATSASAALSETSTNTTTETKKKVLPAETSKKASAAETTKKKSSPEEKKSTAAKPAVVKTKGIQNFFKKQTEKPAATVTKKESAEAIEKKPAANTSIELFEAKDEKDASVVVDVVMSESSDEEEKLDALKRNIISDHEGDDDDAPSTSKPKRRRIEDSDDDDEPQQKHEKKEEKEEAEVIELDSKPTTKSETFMDEDGFVITLKSKKPSVPTKSSAGVSRHKSSVPKSKSPKKRETKPKAAAPTPKTKQGNIMNFFTKK